MKRLAVIIIGSLLVFYGVVIAQPGGQPDQSVFWGADFSSIRLVDGYALCTNNRGLLVAKFDSTSLRFNTVDFLPLPTSPFTAKVYDSVLAVRSEAEVIYFVDIAALPELSLLGEADIGQLFYDFALYNQSLYIALGFDGVRRFQLTGYNDPIFADSSLDGVHCIQTEIDNDALLVLDDYNGVLRYDLSGAGFGEYERTLLIPRRATEFVKAGDDFAVAIAEQQLIYWGSLNDTTAALIDSAKLIIDPNKLQAVDSLVVALDLSVGLAEVYTFPGMRQSFLNLPTELSEWGDGDTYAVGPEAHLLLPGSPGGPLSYNLSNALVDPSPDRAFVRTGPLSAFEFTDDGIIATGPTDQLGFVSWDSLSLPPVNIPGLPGALDLENLGAYTLALYESPNIILVLEQNGGVPTIAESIPVPNGTKAIKQFDPIPGDSLTALLLIGEKQILLNELAGDWQLNPIDLINALLPIERVVLFGDLLLVQEGDYVVTGYRLFDNLQVSPLWTIGGAGSIDLLISTENSSTPSEIYAFDDRNMYRLDFESQALPQFEFVSSLPLEVSDAALVDNGLYTIGERGAGYVDLAAKPPIMTPYGGFPGHLIKFNQTANMLACSDGNVLDLYQIVPDSGGSDSTTIVVASSSSLLRQNFPNPFNPTTTISFTVPYAGLVELTVLNSLGRRVRTLTEQTYLAGKYEVEWDGHNDSGQRAASGVYFYRLSTGTNVETRKMVLLK